MVCQKLPYFYIENRAFFWGITVFLHSRVGKFLPTLRITTWIPAFAGMTKRRNRVSFMPPTDNRNFHERNPVSEPPRRTEKPGFWTPREDQETGFLTWIPKDLETGFLLCHPPITVIFTRETRFLYPHEEPRNPVSVPTRRTKKPGFLLGS